VLSALGWTPRAFCWGMGKDAGARQPWGSRVPLEGEGLAWIPPSLPPAPPQLGHPRWGQELLTWVENWTGLAGPKHLGHLIRPQLREGLCP